MAGSPSGLLLLPTIGSDNNGSFITVECDSVSGQLYIDRLPKERSKRVGQCVLSASRWYTLLEFEKLGGKSAKKWKSSLSHGSRPLSDSNLACSTAVAPQASIPVLAATQAEGTMIIDVVLAFIKAYRLRGDKNNLSTIVLDRFDQSAVEHSKQLHGSLVRQNWRVLVLCTIRDAALIKGSRSMRIWRIFWLLWML